MDIEMPRECGQHVGTTTSHSNIRPKKRDVKEVDKVNKIPSKRCKKQPTTKSSFESAMEIQPKAFEIKPQHFFQSANFIIWQQRCLQSIDYSIPPAQNQTYTQFSKSELNLIFPPQVQPQSDSLMVKEEDVDWENRPKTRIKKSEVKKDIPGRGYSIYYKKRHLLTVSRLKNLIDDVQSCFNCACYRYQNMDALCTISNLTALNMTEEQFQGDKAAVVSQLPIYIHSPNKAQVFHCLRVKQYNLLSRVRTVPMSTIDLTLQSQKMKIISEIDED